MKYEILLLDFDGVVSPGPYFSKIYCEEFGVKSSLLDPFWEGPKEQANIGKADIREELQKVLQEWGWRGSVDELLGYWMNADSDIDERIKTIAEEFRVHGGGVYLATDQDYYRTRFIWEERGLKDWMDGRFVSCEVGLLKENPLFFRRVIEVLHTDPEKIVFFDDSQSKIDAAREIGINAYLYSDFDSVNWKKVLYSPE
jgi:putative hydrolase of the HAD superfamily